LRIHRNADVRYINDICVLVEAQAYPPTMFTEVVSSVSKCRLQLYRKIFCLSYSLIAAGPNGLNININLGSRVKTASNATNIASAVSNPK